MSSFRAPVFLSFHSGAHRAVGDANFRSGSSSQRGASVFFVSGASGLCPSASHAPHQFAIRLSDFQLLTLFPRFLHVSYCGIDSPGRGPWSVGQKHVKETEQSGLESRFPLGVLK